MNHNGEGPQMADVFALPQSYVKHLIKDTIESYSPQWRLLHEAVQNARDAVQANEHIETGMVKISLKVGTNEVVVRDNGTGLPEETLPTLFSLGGTGKAASAQSRLFRGSQGVGIKATVFTSNHFRIETNTGLGAWQLEVAGYHRFLDDDFDGRIPAPTILSPSSTTYTEVAYQLQDYTVVDFLREVVNSAQHDEADPDYSDADQLSRLVEEYIRTETYLGDVHQLLGIEKRLKPTIVEVEVIFDFPTLEQFREFELPRCRFLDDDHLHQAALRTKFPESYLNYEEIHSNLPKPYRVDRLFTQLADVIENPPSYDIRKLLVQKMTKDQAAQLIWQIQKDKQNGKRFLAPDETINARHARLLDRLNGAYLVIGPQTYLRKYLHLVPRQLISVNGLPTNIVLNPPRGVGEIGYLSNVHLILDLNATLGYGKRNIPPVTKGQADAFLAEAFRQTLRATARALVGEKPIEGTTDANPWDKEELYERFSHHDNILKSGPIAYRLGPPKDEQDVVAVFHQLIGAGHLPGYFPLATSGFKTYDSAMYVAEGAEKLGGLKWRDIKTVEFKQRLSQLVQDFSDGVKALEDIDLVVVWNNDYEGEEYSVYSLDRDGIQPLGCAQLLLRRNMQSCQVLVLEDVIKNAQGLGDK